MLGARRVLSAAALLAMALSPTSAGAAQAADVIVSDNFYLPRTLTVQAGSSVLWEQQGNLPHDITADDRSWSSHPACTPFVPGSCMSDGDTFSRPFPQPGTFGYYCSLHGSPGNSMFGTIRVVEPGQVFPTDVLDLRATKSGGNLRVLGAASFGGLAPFELGTDAAGDSVQGTPAIMGMDLTKAAIGQPDGDSGDLVFELTAADLPPNGGLPEAARYAWDMVVTPAGGSPAGFRVSGGFSQVTGPNPAPDTAMPTFKVQRCPGEAASCGSAVPVSAVMNGESNRISVTIPVSVLSTIAGGPITGAEIRAGSFGYQGAAVTSNPQSSAPGPATDRVTLGGGHIVAARSVSVDVVPVGGTPTFDIPATVGADGSFTADVTGLAPGTYDVHAKACFGTNCDTASTQAIL